MANPNMAAEQLLELLLTLKKTTPAAARGILNNQPAIAYALITLMVSMNAINIEVFQKTLAEFGSAAIDTSSSTAPQAGPSSSTSVVPQMLPPPAAPAPISAIPPHLQAHYRTTTPPSHTPTPPYGYATPTVPPAGNGTNGYGHGHPPSSGQPGYGYQQHQPAQGGYGGYQNSYGQHTPHQPPPQAVAPSSTPVLPDAFANIPAEQKALIMRVLAMTPEQINMLPSQERATYIQIRSTLGVLT